MSVSTAIPAATNPLKEMFKKYGQLVWPDFFRRSVISSVDLKRMLGEDGLGGVTSNPAIFEKAISGSTGYTEALEISRCWPNAAGARSVST